MKFRYQQNNLIMSALFFYLLVFTASVFAQEGDPVFAKWSWNNADINSVFDHLSRASGTDFVLAPDIKGKITVSVKNKSWKDVVNIVCNMNQLVAVPEDNYIFIIKEREYYDRIKKKEADKKSLENMMVLQKVIIKLNHTTVDEMEKPVKGLLSQRGKVSKVEHTNSLIIHETADNIPIIQELVAKLDVEVMQISISAKIMEVSSSVKKELGVQWSLFDGYINHLPGGTGVAASVGNIAYGILNPQRFSATLDYLFSEGKSEMVAQPQITTLDNKEAEILMGSRIPYNRVDKNTGITSVEYINVETGLTVTPHLTGNGRIMMDLKPQKQSYTINDAGIITNEQSAKTAVVVNDGETIVIAGLTSDEKTESESGVPVLKNIPILGHLFKSSSKLNDKKDLIIFVTPHLIKRGMDTMPATETSANTGGSTSE